MSSPEATRVKDVHTGDNTVTVESESNFSPALAAQIKQVSASGATCKPVWSSAPLDWDAIHETIQESLDCLTSRVVDRCPRTRWKAGRNSARAFPLLSYRVFHRSDGGDEDPVNVGVTVTLEGSIARISGDISGDESGRVYFDEDCLIEVPSSQEQILKAASLVASRLVDQVKVVLDAIADREFQGDGPGKD